MFPFPVDGDELNLNISLELEKSKNFLGKLWKFGDFLKLKKKFFLNLRQNLKIWKFVKDEQKIC